MGEAGAYAMLLHPSANRVYAEAAAQLTVAELGVFNTTVLGQRLAQIQPATIAGVGYVTFTAPELTERDVAYLSNAAGVYVLFQRRGELLRPVELRRLDQFDDDLLTIQKYPGKTNEQFTKLLLNLTLLAAEPVASMLSGPLRVIDPLCGRGTTLNQALTYGHHAAGLDLDGKDFEAYAAFIQTYLKRKRIKHQARQAPVRRERRVVARRLTVSLAAGREASRASYRAGQTLTLDVVQADTVSALEFFPKASFDALVTDAPYGVQHGSRTVAKGLRRAPLDLLREAAPVWAALLRPGAAMGIAWNTHVAGRDELADLLAAAGLAVLDDGPYARFRHRVDQSITRDILIARRPPDPSTRPSSRRS